MAFTLRGKNVIKNNNNFYLITSFCLNDCKMHSESFVVALFSFPHLVCVYINRSRVWFIKYIMESFSHVLVVVCMGTIRESLHLYAPPYCCIRSTSAGVAFEQWHTKGEHFVRQLILGLLRKLMSGENPFRASFNPLAFKTVLDFLSSNLRRNHPFYTFRGWF